MCVVIYLLERSDSESLLYSGSLTNFGKPALDVGDGTSDILPSSIVLEYRSDLFKKLERDGQKK